MRMSAIFPIGHQCSAHILEYVILVTALNIDLPTNNAYAGEVFARRVFST